jgi:cohesin loading factor subunit SCC2
VEGLPELSREGTINAFRKLLCDDNMKRNVDFWLKCVMNTLSQGQSTFRAKAIKSLSAVIDADPTLMEDEKVTSAIRCRFLDEAISVREAAVDFAGRLVAISSSGPSALPYLDMIIERIRDKGFSVRRRVVGILRDTLNSNYYHPYRYCHIACD